VSIFTKSRGVNIDTPGERVFGWFNVLLMLFLSAVAAIPFLHVIAVSFATHEEAISSRFLLFPTTFTLENFEVVFGNPQVAQGLMMSVIITVGGIVASLFFTALTAYPLSLKELRGRTLIMFLVVFTLLFRAGLVPNYLLILNLGLLDSLIAVILPAAMVPFFLILTINFFRAVPDELRESARMDGANEARVLLSVILPLSKPILATLTLFFAVNYWNEFLRPLLYLSNSNRWPIQVMLRQIVIMSQGLSLDQLDPEQIPPPLKSINMTVIVVATIPILLVYPFLQKHFAKGIMLGSIKG
jgi:putative aldouronate transport system permease protein